ncbi:MAG: hypothetical protein JSV80_04860 [Acidobacteriota bacterium]|nr:MAG: hypothetical protein JSV80_04860 [Acidobacteriota bacterium]
MPFCPACRAEYRRGFERCAHCDEALVAELEPDFRSPEEMARSLVGRPVEPVLVGPLMTLQSVRDELGAARIPCVIGPPPGEEDCRTRSCTPRLALYVASDDVGRLRKHLESGLRNQLASEQLELIEGQNAPFDPAGAACPACGKPLANETTTECPECGLFLGK